MPTRWVFCIFLACYTCVCYSQQPPLTAPNGCGAGWSRYFVPNSIPLLRCEFKVSCDAHDLCYGRCENTLSGDCEYRRCRLGGDLYGKPECVTDKRLFFLTAKAVERRQVCDENFYRQLRTVNANRAACSAFAVIYRDAVKNFGADHFSGIDGFVGPRQPQEEYEGAIREFLQKGTESQFREIVEAADAGKPLVNLRRPITFSPGRGLVNKQ
jgi:hypothetical protein